VPDDRTIVIERCLDDLGDGRVCLLSPLGSRIHAPGAMAVSAHIRNRTGMDVEVMWGDEGFVVRFPEVEHPPDPALLLPDRRGRRSARRATARIDVALCRPVPRDGGTRAAAAAAAARDAHALVAAAEARVRSAGGGVALRIVPGAARDLSRGASRSLRHAALVDTLKKIGGRTLRVATIDSRVPSPFAASLLFSYVANYIYDGDAPLAERARAQALSVDQAQLRELLGDAELRELLDADAIEALERQLQHLDDRYKVQDEGRTP